MLCAAAAIGLLLWGRLILTSNVPRTAVADPEQGTKSIVTSDSEVIAQERSRDRVTVELSTVPARDPFVISPWHFPIPQTVGANTGEGGKSGREPTENAHRTAAIRLAQLQELVAELKLEAVMTQPPMAVINGKAYRQGSFIAPSSQAPFRFRLEAVGTRSVTLECEGHQFQLKIPIPRGEESSV